MAELDTITLGELPTVSEIGENDTFLIARGGRMKQVSPSLIGGGMTVFELETSGSTPKSGEKTSSSGMTFSTIATTGEIFDALPNAIFVINQEEMGTVGCTVAHLEYYAERNGTYIVGLTVSVMLQSIELQSTSADSVMTSESDDSGAGTEIK